MSKKIIFFGGVGAVNAFGGELSKNKEIIRRLAEMGYDMTVIDSFQNRSNKLKLAKNLLKFFIHFFSHPYATVLFSTSFGNVYPLVKLLHFFPIKRHMVYWVIGGVFVDRLAEGYFKKQYLKKIDLFMVEGVKMKKRMVDLGFNNVWHVPNFKTLNRLPQVAKANDGKIHFLFISRITPEKGCEHILNSVNSLNKQGLMEQFSVDFYGRVEGEYKAVFEKAVAEIPNVNYRGNLQLQDEKNYDVLARYHYMLFPTYWMGEGFPGVIIDAYKAGVPIIGSDWNLNSEFIKDKQTGILIPTCSQEKLTEVMKRAVQGDYDNATLSANCQQEVLKYDTRNVITDNLLQIITNINTGGNKEITSPYEA